MKIMMRKFFSIVLLIFIVFSLISCAKKLEYQISSTEALTAVKNYNYKNIPDLEEMVKSDDYTIYWDIVSENENQIVVLFKSYTASMNRYYIDKKTGEAYETVQVPGIIDDEEKTGVTLNIRDYMDK